MNNLRSPDIVSLEEIQDNNGADERLGRGRDVTLTKLVDSITAAGGPTYQFRQIDPVDDQDGGEPGGNIRVGFLFRTDRGVAFVDRPGGGSTTPTTIVSGPDGPELSLSPGRVDPANPAWNASRKPLAGEFTFRGETYFVIINHFNSKGGDQALFGRFQPPTRSTEVQRHQQARSSTTSSTRSSLSTRRRTSSCSGTSTTSSSRRRCRCSRDGVLTRLIEHASAERALQLRLRGQLARASTTSSSATACSRAPVRVRRSARERRVLRSAL